MGLPTLEEFLSKGYGIGRNSYVKFPGFRSLYMRFTERYINGRRQVTIDLASLEATRPGNGAFRALVAELCAKHPAHTIYVENVLTTRFCEGLERMGFRKQTWGDGAPDGAPSYFMYGSLK